MEDSARRRRTRTLGPVLALSLASVGCVAGAARFDVGPPYSPAPDHSVALPAGLEPCATRGLAAAKQALSGPKKGLGLSIAWQSTVFGKWQTKATDAIPTGDPPPNDRAFGQYMYSDLFGDGWGPGTSISFIIGRPPTGVPSAGDTYLLGRYDFQRFPGFAWDPDADPDNGNETNFGPIHQSRFSVEAKTILKPIGRSLRPYARYSVGLVSIESVDAGLKTGDTEPIWDSTATWGLSGGFGIDFHVIAWWFADIGIDVIGAPRKASSLGGVGNAEPMVATPMRIGVLLNF